MSQLFHPFCILSEPCAAALGVWTSCLPRQSFTFDAELVGEQPLQRKSLAHRCCDMQQAPSLRPVLNTGATL